MVPDQALVGTVVCDGDDVQLGKEVSKQKMRRRPADLRRILLFTYRLGPCPYSLGSIGLSSSGMIRIMPCPP